MISAKSGHRRKSRPSGHNSRRAVTRRAPRFGWLARAALACAALALASLAWAAVERALAPLGNTSRSTFDAIVVLGNPADNDGNPTPTQLSRVTEAVREYERGVAPRIILSGGAVKNRFVEARVMARTAEAQGIPAAAIFQDPTARSTVQNTCHAFALMRSHGWQSAEVISSGYHLKRAGLMLSRLPIAWRVRAAAPLEPEGPAAAAFQSSLEVLKTLYYLAWTRQTESCQAAVTEP